MKSESSSSLYFCGDGRVLFLSVFDMIIRNRDLLNLWIAQTKRSVKT